MYMHTHRQQCSHAIGCWAIVLSVTGYPQRFISYFYLVFFPFFFFPLFPIPSFEIVARLRPRQDPSSADASPLIIDSVSPFSYG